MRFVFLLYLLGVSLLSFSQEDSNTYRFRSLGEAFFQGYLALNPTVATSLGDSRYNGQLENTGSAKYRLQSKSLYAGYLDSLKKIDRQKLNDRDRLSYDILKYDLQARLSLLKYPSHLMPVNQFRDFRLTFSQLGSGAGDHPFKTIKDYTDFTERALHFVAVTDTAIANMRLGIKQGRVAPRVIIEKVIPQLQAMITDTPAQSIFYKPILNMPATIDEDSRERLKTGFTEAISTKIIPSYKRLLDFITAEYLPHTTNSVGLSALPGGKDEYAARIKYFTSTNLSADEVFAIGETEVNRIQKEMRSIMKEVGFQGDLQAFFKHLFSHQQFFPFTNDEEIVTAYYSIYEKLRPHISKLFDLVPKTAFEIKPVEKYRAASAAAHYMKGTVDGTRPGIFYFPVVDAKRYHYWRMEDLFLHEAIPGHHFQISLQMENDMIPGFQKIGAYGSYVEGWGLYAESMGKKLGLYTDPYQRMGQLYGEIHRAVRLVVDVGIHYKGWTREQAIKYSLENEPISEATAVQEIERYISYPAQALSYKIGELKLQEIRLKAEQTLGKRFDIKSFHEEVLKDGAMPMHVFEQKMNKWIATQMSR